MTTVCVASFLTIMLASRSDDPRKSGVPSEEHTSAPQSASAHSDAERIRQRVKAGQNVRITDDEGHEWRGRIDTFAPDNLTVVTTIASERTCRTGRSSESIVRTIVSPTEP